MECYWVIEETGEEVHAARHVLLEPIEFEDWVVNAELKVQENAVYKGAQGVALEFSYELRELFKEAPLYVHFYQADGTQLPFDLYYLPGGDIGIPLQHEHVTKNPRKADRMTYFIPYSSLNGQSIGVRAELLPDVAMHITEEFTPALRRPKDQYDADLTLTRADERFRADNYGQVLELKVQVPPFYLQQSELKLEVLENGQPCKSFKVDGLPSKAGRYPINVRSTPVYVVLPYRRLKPGAKFEVRAQVVHSERQTPMSAPFQWSWVAPKRLFNTDIEVVLEQYRFERKLLQDTSLRNNFPWEYVVEAGGDVLLRQPLTSKWEPRKKASYAHSIRVNVEDNLVIKVQHRKTGQKRIIWKGDLSKWEQSDFKASLENRSPLKSIKVSANVPKNYSRPPSTTTTAPQSRL